MTKREDTLLPPLILKDEQKSLLAELNLPKSIVSIVEAENNVKIISFEVFKNYLSILQERNGKRELKTVNLLNNKHYIHQFDQEPERNPSDNLRSQFYDVMLQDNLTFDEVNLNY